MDGGTTQDSGAVPDDDVPMPEDATIDDGAVADDGAAQDDAAIADDAAIVSDASIADSSVADLCSASCTNTHGSAACLDGVCTLTCSTGFADCDGMDSNGCETNIGSDPTHCGTCSRTCNAVSEMCSSGVCTTSPCAAGRGECDNNLAQYCETDLTNSAQNCGFCGNACVAANGSSACSASNCVVTSCNPNYDNCDGVASNGCEAALLTRADHCGRCGAACLNAHGTSTCVSGVCAPMCSTGYGDCDVDRLNGCETSLNTITDCGMCGRVCPANGGTPGCSAGSCTTTCDITGRWALKLTVPVTWPGTSVLASGSGNFTFWLLLQVTQSGNGLSGSVIPCGETVPDFRSVSFPILGVEQYGVQLPNALFDGALLPGVAASGSLSSAAPGSTFTLARTAFMTGMSMADPVNGAWPSAGATTSVDSDADGKPGLTAPYKSGGSYDAAPVENSYPPTRAQSGYLASRIVFTLSGTLDTCTTSSGTVTAQDVDYHTLGCRITGNSRDCNATEATYLDTNGPNYVTSAGPYALAKVAGNATCATVRAAVP